MVRDKNPARETTFVICAAILSLLVLGSIVLLIRGYQESLGKILATVFMILEVPLLAMSIISYYGEKELWSRLTSGVKTLLYVSLIFLSVLMFITLVILISLLCQYMDNDTLKIINMLSILIAGLSFIGGLNWGMAQSLFHLYDASASAERYSYIPIVYNLQ